MKQLNLVLMLLCIAGSFCISTVSAQQKISQSMLNGCWQRVQVIQDGKIDNHPAPQMRLYCDGFFSFTGMDSTGAWKIAYSGTYTIAKEAYKEKMQYSTFPSFANGEHWQDMTLKGDTLRFKLFKRRIDSTGKDIPAPAYTRQLVLVRVKK